MLTTSGWHWDENKFTFIKEIGISGYLKEANAHLSLEFLQFSI